MTQTFVKKAVLWENCGCGVFSGDKGDYIDVWMIKITIETIKMDVCFFQK